MSMDHDHPAMTEGDLVRLAQEAGLAAFEELVARHRDKLYARAYSMMRNEDDALDLSQDAWVKGWRRLAQFQGDSSFVTWMTRIVINLCLDQLRRLVRTRGCPDGRLGRARPRSRCSGG
jgi:RNA polymerase sigma-70 factor (ECF subfamily)